MTRSDSSRVSSCPGRGRGIDPRIRPTRVARAAGAQVEVRRNSCHGSRRRCPTASPSSWSWTTFTRAPGGRHGGPAVPRPGVACPVAPLLVSRGRPDVSLARLRASHDLREVRSPNSRYDVHETAEVLEPGWCPWPEDTVEELQCPDRGLGGRHRAGGNGPARGGTILEPPSAVPGRSRPRPPSVQGTACEVADYFFDEVLRQQPSVLREFMLSTSVLHRFSAPLCDAMMNRSDSASVLAQLERDNAFVVPLDGQRTWYRYHHLFQEMLRAELDRQHPKVSQDLLARAADWHELHGSADEAFEYARVIGDFDRAGRVLFRHMENYVSRGRIQTVRRWFETCSDDEIESDPKLSIGAGWFVSHLGEAERAWRYIEAAGRFELDSPSPDGASTLHASLINLRATLGIDGIGQMLEDGLSLCATEAAAGTRWLRSGYRICGTAQIMLGHVEEAIGSFEQVVLLTEDNAQTRAGRAFCLGYLGLAYSELGNWTQARRCCNEADELMSDHESTVDGLPVQVARALVLAKDGAKTEASKCLAALQPVLSRARSSPPLLADLSARCAEIAHEVGQRETALALYDAARRACSQIPDAGAIPERLDRLERRMAPGGQQSESLTPAELRVLRQLATHRSLGEIAQHLHVSRSTVKTQVAAIYSKLDVSSRAEAVEVLGPVFPSN